MSKTENKHPKYLQEYIDKWEAWTGIKDEDLDEALKDISGDLNFEIRKFQSQVLTLIESFDKELNVSIKAPVEQPDGSLIEEEVILLNFLKSFMKRKIAEMWRDIVAHQNVGIDKLCLVTRKYLDDNKVGK